VVPLGQVLPRYTFQCQFPSSLLAAPIPCTPAPIPCCRYSLG
jgi:hypothetical protein